MINRKYYRLVFAFLMALFMSGLMSLVISVYNMGLVSNIIDIWFHAWPFAFVIAFPTIMMVAPVVDKLTHLIIQDDTTQTP